MICAKPSPTVVIQLTESGGGDFENRTVVPWEVSTHIVYIEHAVNVRLVRLHSCWVDVQQYTAADSRKGKS